MLSYKEEYKLMQEKFAQEKFRKFALRALAVQKRAKIKPSAMNPVLLNPLTGAAFSCDPTWTDEHCEFIRARRRGRNF